MDGHGRPVTDLQRQEFRVLEDGRPQALVHFSEARDPARAPPAPGGRQRQHERRAEDHQRADGGRTRSWPPSQPEDEVALAGFDSEYWGIVPFTTRPRPRSSRASARLEPFGSTALHDALDHAARDLASQGEGRRAVVVITDGVDTSSQKPAEDVIARSRALDVPIYAVSVVSPARRPGVRSSSRAASGRAAATAGTDVLARYATLSGGASLHASATSAGCSGPPTRSPAS